MIEILKILKNSSIQIDNINENDIPNTLFKKCSFRKNDNFINIFNINYKNYIFEIWGKNKGKENQLNNFNFIKYFSTKIYGDCIVLLKKDNNYNNFDFLKWQKLFEKNDNLSNDNQGNDGDDNNNEDNDSDDDYDDDDDENYSIELKEESFIYTSEEDN